MAGLPVVQDSLTDQYMGTGPRWSDRDFALEFITSTDLVMETDKLIDRQLDQMTVSVTCGFRKITPEAVKVLTVEAGE